MNETQSKSERTRQFIIEKTAPIFNTKGYVGTSMLDLTEATKLTKGSIYGNFSNKEEVALAAFHHNLQIRTNAIASHVSAAKTYTEKLLVLPTIFNSKNNHVFPIGGCPLLNTGIEADDTHEDFRAAVSKELLQWKKSISSIIRKGIAEGEFREDISIERTSLSIIAIIEGGIFISQSTKNPAHLDLVLETIKDIVRGILIDRKKK